MLDGRPLCAMSNPLLPSQCSQFSYFGIVCADKTSSGTLRRVLVTLTSRVDQHALRHLKLEVFRCRPELDDLLSLLQASERFDDAEPNAISVRLRPQHVFDAQYFTQEHEVRTRHSLGKRL